MSNVKPQPISGVSAGVEAEITVSYPSVAATAAGQRIGAICNAIPLKTYGVPWPRLLIALPLWLVVVPIALVVALTLYALIKIGGNRYVLTNRNLQVRKLIGVQTFSSTPLADIKDVVIQELPGQSFYKAADLVAVGGDRKTLVRLAGVQRPEVFRQTILEARDARIQVEESLKTIRSRKHS